MEIANYPVHETFHSWQGEGVHAGRSAFFIRLQGCPVRCPWCDSSGTWGANGGGRVLTSEVLAKMAVEAGGDFVVITGGEPGIHDLWPLTRALGGAGRRIHLETCGAFPLRGEFDWIALSPKRAALPTAENFEMADEQKWIIERPEDLDYWAAVSAKMPAPSRTGQSVWLHPEWSRRGDAVLLGAISKWVREHGQPYRAGWQMHKLYGVE